MLEYYTTKAVRILKPSATSSTAQRCLLTLDLKPIRSYVKGKHFAGKEFQSLAV